MRQFEYFPLSLLCRTIFAMAMFLGIDDANAHWMMIAQADLKLPQGSSQLVGRAALDDAYKLGSGDKLRIIVFGEDDLGGEFQIDGSGVIRLPLIAQVQAAGLTVRQFEIEVTNKLNDGYLKNARVSVDVINYRPFYILGEVNKPGEYSYVNGMSLLNAVALAGGYTYRANERNVYIRRNGAIKEDTVPADPTTKINPGDIIRIPERFF